jgi:hypothetical protein
MSYAVIPPEHVTYTVSGATGKPSLAFVIIREETVQVIGPVSYSLYRKVG